MIVRNDVTSICQSIECMYVNLIYRVNGSLYKTIKTPSINSVFMNGCEGVFNF